LETRRELFQSLTGNRRTFLKAAATGTAAALTANADTNRQPNVILICCDDLGFGDLGSYGGTIRTPNLDQLAQEGIRCTQHTSAACICTPARASILTGRYPNRYGIPRVLNPNDNYGLPNSEVTIAQMLKPMNYATICIGKWHLGDLPQFLPNSHGFDDFYGIPYSADMYPLPLLHNLDIVEPQTDASLLMQKFTQRAVNFISNSAASGANRPFFMYFAPPAPHLPLLPSAPYQGSSGQGLYGDVVTELDASIGLIMQSLKANGLDSNTLVMFTSDHGPWYQGSTGGLRQRKGEIFEGGVRVPMLARFPGAIPAGRVSSTLTTSLDFLPTIAAFTGASLPTNPSDGIDISPLLHGWQTELTRDAFLYFNDVELQAARIGPWKLHVARFNSWAFSPEPAVGRLNLPLPNPELYNVIEDNDESHDRSLRNFSQLVVIRSRMDALLQTFPPEIIGAWSYTLSSKVQNTSIGALPVLVTTS
jgi:arylsulfatase A